MEASMCAGRIKFGTVMQNRIMHKKKLYWKSWYNTNSLYEIWRWKDVHIFLLMISGRQIVVSTVTTVHFVVLVSRKVWILFPYNKECLAFLCLSGCRNLLSCGYFYAHGHPKEIYQQSLTGARRTVGEKFPLPDCRHQGRGGQRSGTDKSIEFNFCLWGQLW